VNGKKIDVCYPKEESDERSRKRVSNQTRVEVGPRRPSSMYVLRRWIRGEVIDDDTRNANVDVLANVMAVKKPSPAIIRRTSID